MVKQVINQLRQKLFASKPADNSITKVGLVVERPWGCFETLELDTGYQVKRIIVHPGAKLSLQSHQHRSEHWVVVNGIARVTNGDKVFTVSENQSTYIPVGTKHRVENIGDENLTFIEVQVGDYLGEDDITRYEDDYGR